jgi:hypothetical protein
VFRKNACAARVTPCSIEPFRGSMQPLKRLPRRARATFCAHLVS